MNKVHTNIQRIDTVCEKVIVNKELFLKAPSSHTSSWISLFLSAGADATGWGYKEGRQDTG